MAAVSRVCLVLVESKGSNLSTARISVMRNRGTYGHVSVMWRVQGYTDDLHPSDGVVVFQPGQAIAYISVTSSDDEVGIRHTHYYCLPVGQNVYIDKDSVLNIAAMIVKSKSSEISLKHDLEVLLALQTKNIPIKFW